MLKGALLILLPIFGFAQSQGGGEVFPGTEKGVFPECVLREGTGECIQRESKEDT